MMDHRSYEAALDRAEQRARRSYFDQHIIADREAGYINIDEEDYRILPMHLVDRIVHTVQGGLMDDL